MTRSSSMVVPKTAWPTVLLAMGSTGLFVLAFVLAVIGTVSTGTAAAMVFVASFTAFTPMHDASHRSVSRRRWLNAVVGRLCSTMLGAPFAAFRFAHLEHHRHTNEPGQDPDLYSGRGPAWMLPLRWMTQDLHYYVFVLRFWRKRPVRERIDFTLQAVLIVALIAVAAASGFGELVVLAWLVPTRLAIVFLALAFDYLPHVPHQTPASEDRFAATRIIEGPGLTTLMLYQNYHLIHHLYPGVPFYRYRRVFRERGEELMAKGARVVRLGDHAA